jgi:hypothetical protein
MSERRTTLLALALALGVCAAEAPAQARRESRYIAPGVAPRGPGWAVPPRPAHVPGLHPRVRVMAPTRFDWASVLPPGEAKLAEHVSTRTFYSLYVPPTYGPRAGQPFLLFLPADDQPADLKTWEPICRKYGVVFAAPHDTGKGGTEVKRVRIALDVLDDVRRRLHIDTDRCYLAGAGGGARTACRVSFAFPEAFGGTLAIGGGAPPPLGPERRQRVQERLSVALLHGERGPGAAEVERFLFPLLRDGGAQVRRWSCPGADRAQPGASTLEEAFLWLESSLPRRQLLGAVRPASRLANGAVPSPEEWAKALLQEGRQRLRVEGTRVSGLMQLAAVTTRWPGSAAAAEAGRELTAYNARARAPWQDVSREEQLRFAYRQARAFDAYLPFGLAGLDAAGQARLAREGLAYWALVAEHGKDTKMGREAKGRVDRLRRALGAAAE